MCIQTTRGQDTRGKTAIVPSLAVTISLISAKRQSKSRRNFLETLQGENPIYVLNEYARSYLELYDLAAKYWQKLQFSAEVLAREESQWSSYLESNGILTPKAKRLISEAALLGGLMEKGVSEQLRILSDGAGQFNVLVHSLCLVHAERALRSLSGKTSEQRQNIEEMQQLLWDYYRQLQEYSELIQLYLF